MKKHLVVAATAIFITISTVFAQDLASSSYMDKVPFEKIGRIGVLVEGMGDRGKKAGISEDELKAFVELKLRQNGIVVRPIDDFTSESPYIYININLLDLDTIKHFAYSASVALKQTVRLLRNDKTLTAATWEKGNVAIIPRKDVRADVKETLDILLTFFLNDYLSANPPGPK